MQVQEAREARREGRRVEWFDHQRGGWRRGELRSISRQGLIATVLETGKSRGKRLPLADLRLAEEKLPPSNAELRRRAGAVAEMVAEREGIPQLSPCPNGHTAACGCEEKEEPKAAAQYRARLRELQEANEPEPRCDGHSHFNRQGREVRMLIPGCDCAHQKPKQEEAIPSWSTELRARIQESDNGTLAKYATRLRELLAEVEAEMAKRCREEG